MKKLTHLGCLLALVFAGASAFADSWFTNVVQETSGNGWSVPAGEGKWTWNTTYGTLNDWDVGAVYTANVAKAVSSYDSKITTTVKFTAMDAEDLLTYDISSAKAGVTVVEVVNGNATTYAFKVIENGAWADAGVSTNSLDEPITVTVKFDKANENGSVSQVTYVIGDKTVVGGTASGTIQSVEYKGQCDLYNDLTGLAWGNVPGTPSAVEITSYPQDYNGPTTIKYNHGALKARLGAEADSDAKVIEYMTGKQKNGQFGWVNYALGQADNAAIAIKSNELSTVEGQLAVDFGFDIDMANYTVTYTVDGEPSDVPAVGINVTKIHEIKVSVSTNEEEPTTASEIATSTVGVMKTGKDTTGLTGSTFDIVAVPWESFNGEDTVTVASLFVTSELKDGDVLYVLKNQAAGVAYYDTFEFDSKTGWMMTVNYNNASEATTADDYMLPKGTALWLEHSVASKIVFAGGVGDLSETYEATAKAGEWTLVANPSIKSAPLSQIVSATSGDRIVIEDVAAPAEYRYENSSWEKLVEEEISIPIPGGEPKSFKQPSWKSGDYSIPAGIGFWYVNADTEDKKITFPNNTIVK